MPAAVLGAVIATVVILPRALSGAVAEGLVVGTLLGLGAGLFWWRDLTIRAAALAAWENEFSDGPPGPAR